MEKEEGMQPDVMQVIIKGVAKGSFGGCVESNPETCRAGKSALHTVRSTTKEPGRVQGKIYRGDWEKRLKMSKLTKLFKGNSSSSSSSSSKSRHHHRSHAGPTPQEAIHKLRETEEMLTKKQDFLEKRIEQELMTAKKHGTKNKQGKFLLKYNVLVNGFMFLVLEAIGAITIVISRFKLQGMLNIKVK